jgi:hypothetical protein
MLRRSYCLIIFVLLFGNLLAKELPSSYDAPVTLSKIDQLKIKHANELMKEGRALWDKLNSNYNPENVTTYKTDSIYNKDAYPILMKAAKIFLEANKLKYTVYRNNCDDFWKKHKYSYPTGLDNAKKFQKEANSYIDSALLNRKAADNYTNKYVLSYNRFYEAIALEIIATKKEARALQIYLDWPVHYAYDWDEDVEVNLFVAKPVDQGKILESTHDTIIQAPPLVVGNPHDSTIIFYSIQIAAHTIPMTESNIRANIYRGPMLIREIWEDGWYKYLIGHYKNADEAGQLLRRIDVEKAFVVAYRNGKRVLLKDAEKQDKP